MKKIFIALLILGSASNLCAQNSNKQHEIGLSFYGFHGFGLTYRVVSPTALWRFTGLSIYGQSQNNRFPYYLSGYKEDRTSNSLGLEFGREFRKPLNDKLDLRYGADATLYYSVDKGQEVYISNPDPQGIPYKNSSVTPGLNAVIGVNYKINDLFLIGAELNPGFGYSMTSAERTVNNEVQKVKGHNFTYSIENSARLTLVCKF